MRNFEDSYEEGNWRCEMYILNSRAAELFDEKGSATVEELKRFWNLFHSSATIVTDDEISEMIVSVSKYYH